MPRTLHITIDSHWGQIANGRGDDVETTWTGTVEAPSMTEDGTLEWLFGYFNRVEPADSGRLDFHGYRLPSLSTRDRITVNGVMYEVKPMGFERLDPEPMDVFQHAIVICAQAPSRAESDRVIDKMLRMIEIGHWPDMTCAAGFLHPLSS
jgi:hypothetical protein